MISKEELKQVKCICDWLYNTKKDDYKSFIVSDIFMTSNRERIKIRIEKLDGFKCSILLDNNGDDNLIQCDYTYQDEQRDLNLKWVVDVDDFKNTILFQNMREYSEKAFDFAGDILYVG